MTFRKLFAGIALPAFAILSFSPKPVLAEPLIWGIQAEQAEYRIGDDTDVFAWDFDALVGRDELKFVWRSEGEFATKEDKFESLENQLRVQVPISTFFDAVGGVRYSSPSAGDRIDGVVGLHGLAPQFFEVDADLFVGKNPSARFEVDYEALITNRLIATPSIELDVPFTDDGKYGRAAFGPTLEVGFRVSYDMVDRLLSPYVGVHYERSFGGTANIKRSEGEDAGAVFFVVGAKMIF
jgi:copper resistance protein B